MSVTQGLAELKLLDKRIRKLTKQDAHGNDDYYTPSQPSQHQMRWLSVRTKSAPVDAEKLKKEAQADWQSFTDLVDRRDRIKKAIVLSNASTRVRIGEWEGTVAEAIEHKSSIVYKKQMLEVAKAEILAATADYKEKQAEVQSRLDRLLQSELSKDVRTNPETLQAITTSFLENNKVELVDPLDLKEKVKRLEQEVEEFETNVDWTLSQANGTAIIEV